MANRAYVVFLWNNGFREYRPEHVNILAHAVRHFDPDPHRFICITDLPPTGFSPAVTVLPMPPAAAALGSLKAPQGKHFPSSYRRLWCFSDDAKILGGRIMLLDVDAMVVGDLRSLWAKPNEFVGWRPMSIWGREDRIGGGTWMLTPGTRTKVWDRFTKDPEGEIAETAKLGWTGSDQAILSRYLKGCAVWPQYCGIYGSQDGLFTWDLPPKDCRIVHSNGAEKAWNMKKLFAQAYHNHFREIPADLR